MISVLIPTYNPKRAHLTGALQSIQAQTNGDWQVLVHDDCSETSEAQSIVEPFLKDSRITFKKSPVRLGIGGNWNACVRQTDAPFVAFLFQDDLWEPDYLERALRAFNEAPSVGFVSLSHRYLCEGVASAPLYDAVKNFTDKSVDAGLHRGREFLRWWIDRELHPNVVGEPSFVVMRRSAMMQAGPFLEDMPQFLDVEYWTRLLTITDWYFAKEKSFGSFRVHPGGASAVNEEAGAGLGDRLRCFESLIGILNGNDRRAAIAARRRAVEKMVIKFFARVGSKKHVSSKSKGDLKKFCLRHPVLIGTSIVKYLMRGQHPQK